MGYLEISLLGLNFWWWSFVKDGPYVLMHYVEESVEARGLTSVREICLAFNVSQSMNLLKHLQSLWFIKVTSNLWNLLKAFFLKKENGFTTLPCQKNIHKSTQITWYSQSEFSSAFQWNYKSVAW